MTTKNQVTTLGTAVKPHGPLARSFRACRNAATKLIQLRERLILKLAAEVQGQLSEVMVRKALIEAEALAWSTRYPLLFLPVLAEEKVRDARQWTGRQEEILARQKALATIL